MFLPNKDYHGLYPIVKKGLLTRGSSKVKSTSFFVFQMKTSTFILNGFWISLLIYVQNTFKSGWEHSLVPSVPPRNKTLAIALKKYTKIDTKVFQSCQFYSTSLFFFQMFCVGLQIMIRLREEYQFSKMEHNKSSFQKIV